MATYHWQNWRRTARISFNSSKAGRRRKNGRSGGNDWLPGPGTAVSRPELDIYQHFGFVQIIECVSEEILFRHSQALAVNGREAEAAEYLQRAYDEMMRKHDLIPSDSPFRRTYLQNIPLHRLQLPAAVRPLVDPLCGPVRPELSGRMVRFQIR